MLLCNDVQGHTLKEYVMRVYGNNALSIGNTPLVRLNRVADCVDCCIAAKIEGRNPAYSVKCRLAFSLVRDAIERGIIKEGMTIIEATSGNTGIGLAYVGAAYGYKTVLIMPDTMSAERRAMMSAFGAEFILTPGAKGMAGAVAKAEELAASEPEKYFYARQFENPANPLIHYETTGPEIWDDTDGNVKLFVAGVGTGGTVTGVSHYLKQKAEITTIAVEPANSPVISQMLAGEELKPSPHKIQGIGAGFIPKVLNLDLIDEVIQIEDEEAIEMARRLAKEEGIICGISSGAAVAATLKAVKKYKLDKGDIAVTILPDSGERYLSMGIF